jgi:hemerythrin-like domain-containing protein
MATTKKARATSRGKDAISLLMKDHVKVRGLLKKLENAADRGDDRAVDLLAQVDREVKIHSQVEEEIFYPAFKEAARTKEENKLFYEAEEEHHVVDLVMPEVHDSEGEGEDFAAKTKVLKDLIEHHADEEEKQMFPKAKKLFDREELQELGRRIQMRKEELGAE